MAWFIMRRFDCLLDLFYASWHRATPWCLHLVGEVEVRVLVCVCMRACVRACAYVRACGCGRRG